MGVEVSYNQRGQTGSWTALFDGCQLPCLCHADGIGDMLPELIADLVVGLHVCINEAEGAPRAALLEINANPAFRGELVEPHHGQIRIEAHFGGGSPAVSPPGDGQTGSEHADDVVLTGRTLKDPARSGKSGGPGAVATPDLLESDDVCIGGHPCHHLLDRSAEPGEAADIVTQQAKGVHYLSEGFWSVEANAGGLILIGAEDGWGQFTASIPVVVADGNPAPTPPLLRIVGCGWDYCLHSLPQFKHRMKIVIGSSAERVCISQ
jgi:hypothetical protein